MVEGPTGDTWQTRVLSKGRIIRWDNAFWTSPDIPYAWIKDWLAVWEDKSGRVFCSSYSRGSMHDRCKVDADKIIELQRIGSKQVAQERNGAGLTPTEEKVFDLMVRQVWCKKYFTAGYISYELHHDFEKNKQDYQTALDSLVSKNLVSKETKSGYTTPHYWLNVSELAKTQTIGEAEIVEEPTKFFKPRKLVQICLNKDGKFRIIQVADDKLVYEHCWEQDSLGHEVWTVCKEPTILSEGLRLSILELSNWLFRAEKEHA